MCVPEMPRPGREGGEDERERGHSDRRRKRSIPDSEERPLCELDAAACRVIIPDPRRIVGGDRTRDMRPPEETGDSGGDDDDDNDSGDDGRGDGRGPSGEQDSDEPQFVCKRKYLVNLEMSQQCPLVETLMKLFIFIHLSIVFSRGNLY